MKVAVGSKNPVKIEAVRRAFSQVWPHEKWEVEGVAVPSGVSDQPRSDSETLKGARTRAWSAREAFDAEYGVGLEGGLQEIEGQWFESGWMVVVNRAGEEGIGTSVRFLVAPKIMELIDSGLELGDVCDQLFNMTKSGQGKGFFGIMSNNLITRESAFKDAVVVALARFLRPELFSK